MVLDPRHPLVKHFNPVIKHCDSFPDVGNSTDQGFHGDAQISDITSEPCRDRQVQACQRNAYGYDPD